MYGNLLNNLFYEIWNEGYIYEEDENELGMSYGEYAAINDTFEEELVDTILNINDLEEAAETLKNIMDRTGDDIRVFFDTEDYDDFDYYIDEYEGTAELYHVPEKLKEHFESLLEDYLYEHQYEEYEYEVA